MNSTATKKAKPRQRKSQYKRRPTAARKPAPKKEPAPGIVDWLAFGATGEAGVLPEWADLSSKKPRNKKARAARKQVDTFFSKVTTRQFAAGVLVFVFGVGLYVSHIFATQDTLSQLTMQQREHLRLELQYNQLKGQLDKKISQNEIYHRAIELGLRPGHEFGPVVEWEMQEGK